MVSPSVATAHETAKHEGALVVVGDPRDNEQDREVQMFIIVEEALMIRLEAQLKETLEFMEMHGHHNQMVRESNSLDSIEEAVCRIATCESACKDAQGQSPNCHLRQHWDRLGSEPAGPTASASEPQLPVQRRPAADEDSMAVDDGVPRRFPALEHVETMMCEREVEPQEHQASVHQVHYGVAPAASSPSIHQGKAAAPSGPQVHHGVAFAASSHSIHHA